MRTLVATLALAASAALAQPSAEETLSAVVGVSSKIASGARSAATLGTQRRGTGALIREQYVLTIGYLVMEAPSVEVTSSEGRTVPATVVSRLEPARLGRYLVSTGWTRPGLFSTWAPPSRPATGAPSRVADMTRMRRSSRRSERL